jgi:hypothetical protein
MPEAMTVQQQAMQQARRRGQILAFEAALAQVPGAVFGDNALCPLTHHFGEGTYMREMRIPAGTLIVGKIHKHAHPVFLLQGALLLMTEAGGLEEVRAPRAFIAPGGAKRAALALEETVWITVHANPTDTQDLAQLEAAVIAPTFAAYDAFRAQLTGGTLPARTE